MSSILRIHGNLVVVSDYGVEILNFVGVPRKFFDIHWTNHGQCAGFHKSEYAFDHVDESSEEDPQIKSVEKASDQSLFVFEGVLEPLFNDFFKWAELIGDIIPFKTKLAF